jgi:glycosyltransferase involved in cell wall biosynthesis
MIGQEYANSSMLVMSSNYEGFPMVMIEAMAAGLPIVSFDFKCGPRDIITHGVDGFIVPNGDIYALAQSMMQLMSNSVMRRSMGLKAQKITQTYSETIVMGKWLDLFMQLTSI